MRHRTQRVRGHASRGLFLTFGSAMAIAALACALVNGGDRGQAQALPQADIVFLIDESVSMGDDIAEVQTQVNASASQLSASVDPLFALIGFGANSSHSSSFGGAFTGGPHTHTDFATPPA